MATGTVANTSHVWQCQYFGIKGNQYRIPVLIPVLGSMMLLLTNSASVWQKIGNMTNSRFKIFAIDKCNI